MSTEKKEADAIEARRTSSDIFAKGQEIKQKLNKDSKDKGSQDLKAELTMTEHKVDLEDLIQTLGTNIEKGMTNLAVGKRRETEGLNKLTPAPEDPEWVKFLRTQTGFFSLLLWGGSILCFIGYGLKKEIDNLYLGIVLAFMVLVTGIFIYTQEKKSGDLMKSFKVMMTTQSRSPVAILLGVTFFLIGLGFSLNWISNLECIIGIIVANVPEALLATVTVCLTFTAKRMYTKRVMVKLLLSTGRFLDLRLQPWDPICPAVRQACATLGLDFDDRCWLSVKGRPLKPEDTALGLGLTARPRQRRRGAVVVLKMQSPGLLGGGIDWDLWSAAERGDEAEVRRLLRAGASVKFKDGIGGDTALHCASMCGHPAVVAQLLSCGAAVDVRDEDGLTALHFASAKGHPAVVAELLSCGAAPGKE